MESSVRHRRAVSRGVSIVAAILVVFCLLAGEGRAQNLRYDNRREVRVPDDATLRLGPFYSTWVFSLTAGYRYVNTTGTGENFLFGGSRGELKKDGSDLPLIATLNTRNYLIITPHTDLDISVGVSYEYYPFDTQDSRWRLFVPDEGLNASLSLGFEPWPFVRGELYDKFSWRTDYIDTRGIEDRYGGQEFEVFENTVGTEIDCLVAERQTVGLGLSRNDRIPIEDGWEEQARVTHAGHLLYEWQFVDYAVLGLRAGAAHTDYTETNRASVLITDYTANLTVQATERTRLQVFGGYAMASISGDDPREGEDLSSVIYGGGLETKLSPNLSHALNYAHGIRLGYNTAAEEYDLLRYSIRWTGERTSVEPYTQYQVTDPSRTNLGEYTDWTSGVTLNHALRSYLTLNASTRYSIRTNEETTDETLDPEYRTDYPEDYADYKTWASRLGFTTRLSEEYQFVTYVEHIERCSDDPDLEYTRDVLAAFVTYTHLL